MDTTFISIHDLTPEARILYSSDSVIDILGYTPDEIVNRSAWDFFPPEELPYAQKFHEKRVSMDKAAVLAYCQVRNKQGEWTGCECCFTIVYDVMIVCTSIYRQGLASQKRALEAPMVRRMFSSSPKDPRYHMLSHISAKFRQPSKPQEHEPRAALFLNRFTRTLTIMYATNGLQEVIGIPAETMRGRSFYYCIAENCLQDAIKCLENAKGNDSIAYLRFWFRDPRIDDQPPPPDDESSDEEMTTDVSEDMSEGGVNIGAASETSANGRDSSNSSNAARSDETMDVDQGSRPEEPNSRTSSGDSTNPRDTHEAIFGASLRAESSSSSAAPSPEQGRASPVRPQPVDPVELEAVISCASDGLVVCLRKARPMIPHPTHRPSRPVYENGLFAAPWAPEPMLPPLEARPGAGFGQAFAPALGPQAARSHGSPVQAGGPSQQDFMNSIRDQAIFAWALTGINGTLAEFGQGKPYGESLPKDGLPVWSSDPIQSSESDKNSNGWQNGREMFGASNRSPQDGRLGPGFFGDPGLDKSSSSRSISSTGNGNSNGNSNGGTPGTR
ncbi:hypothetical protein KC332_g4594 [Hortaea werneckii]|uniref:PAS domain-containing protein n=2 Tax=Hortaea werneckii TaxID=91943 RepID=A0A3M7IMG8_HORWE|nr:hypothetical protein KC358_g8532 [Hortaea werneckii]OTA24461.1 hypothetical protein BTJ68_11970 [Hortaea werneckii EXF-2000]KAI6849341.1 hypothetical protein KC350_g2660 [Hortaea werneckii]KAI6933262.1 hypothetical protein KC341_g8407 [Hortaea werneckii]KAI6946017.1 hypothetical protein KC348_g3412 [Hortaea werneckii]